MKTHITLVCILFSHFAYPQTWSAMGTGMTGTTSPSLNALQAYNGEMYSIGNFTVAGGTTVNYVARWDGSTWNSCGTGLAMPLTNPSAQSITAFNGELYVGGNYTMAGGVSAIHMAKWNGTAWAGLGAGAFNLNGSPLSLVEYNGELVAAGRFDSAGTVAITPGLAKWDGLSWSSLGTVGLNIPIDEVRCLFGYNNELYAGGSFDSIGGIAANNIAKWNGSTWTELGSGLTSPSGGNVTAITYYNGEIYVAGLFTMAGGVPAINIARWDGTSWNDCGSNLVPVVYELCVYNGELYAGGNFTSPVAKLAKWDGTSWSGVGSITGGNVTSMAVYNGDLIVGGSFTSAGGISVNRIARLNMPVGMEEYNLLQASIYPNPTAHSFMVTSPAPMDRIEIMDPSGRLIQKQDLHGVKETRIEMEAPGLYFIKLISGSSTLVRKVFISGS